MAAQNRNRLTVPPFFFIMKNNEALRCLLCKKPKCSTGCPVRTAVPTCMELYREGRLEEAGEILFRNNPLSAITSQVCDWRDFCYGNCVLNIKKIAVRWYEIEQEISDLYLFNHPLKRRSSNLVGRRIAIVGGGPVGIAAAVWFYEAGATVTIFEAHERLGGVLRYGIPPFRLDKKYVDVYEKLFAEAGIELRTGSKLDADALTEITSDYDAVLLGCGAEKTLDLGIPGEKVPSVIQALDFLAKPEAFEVKGRKVIVIGGGNVAMDACRTAAHLGADTAIYYRKTYENMPANPIEIELAQRDGVRIKVFEAPVEVKSKTVVFRSCENFFDPESGKLMTRILNGTDHEVPCDILIKAIGEKPDFTLLQGLGCEFDNFGWPLTGDNGTLVCRCDNVFIAGDFIIGPSTVVQAVASAKKAVHGIIDLLK